MLTDTWVFDVAASSWEELHDADAQSYLQRAYHSVAVLGQRVYVYGGTSLDLHPTADGDVQNNLPGCNTGTFSSNFSSIACQPCAVGTYALIAGSTTCLPCPDLTTTLGPGKTSASDCSVCTDNACNGHGSCEVQLDMRGQYQAVCSCDLLYLTSPRCAALDWWWWGGPVILFVLIVGIIVYRWFKQRYANPLRKANLRIHEAREEVIALTRAWRIAPQELELQQRIDSDAPGAFGEVWAAQYHGRPVAVKKLQDVVRNMDPSQVSAFEDEIELMRRIRHGNIVHFYGAGYDERGTPFLVVEFMEKGSLTNILGDLRIPLNWQTKMRFAIDAAKGMAYLHSLGIIHRDLKSANLLVTETWIVKVSDFGTSAFYELAQLAAGGDLVPVMSPRHPSQRTLARKRNGAQAASNTYADDEGTALLGAEGGINGDNSDDDGDVDDFDDDIEERVRARERKALLIEDVRLGVKGREGGREGGGGWG